MEGRGRENLRLPGEGAFSAASEFKPLAGRRGSLGQVRGGNAADWIGRRPWQNGAVSASDERLWENYRIGVSPACSRMPRRGSMEGALELKSTESLAGQPLAQGGLPIQLAGSESPLKGLSFSHKSPTQLRGEADGARAMTE
jgi:hypothetical protein